MKIMKVLEFVKIAIGDYKRVGAIVPSSRYVVKRAAKEIKGRKVIAEYGAGDGVISKEILKNIPNDGILLAFETNKNLFRELKKIKDSRIVPINDDVRNISSHLKAKKIKSVDAVISGIPFSMMKKNERKKIIYSAFEVLSKDGIAMIYQTSPLVLSILKKYFSRVRTGFEIKNIPPYFIMIANK